MDPLVHFAYPALEAVKLEEMPKFDQQKALFAWKMVGVLVIVSET